jgi:predicted HicB family RNase H-like nuclease
VSPETKHVHTDSERTRCETAAIEGAAADPETSRGAVLNLRINAGLKARVQQRAKREGRSVSAVCETFLREYADEAPARLVAADPAHAESKRFTVTLPAFLYQAAQARAKASGLKPARWVAALVRANLMQEVPLLAQEQEAAARAISELAAIGRNLNQIARALNLAPHESHRLRLDFLKLLSERIDTVKAALRALINASNGLWRTV